MLYDIIVPEPSIFFHYNTFCNNEMCDQLVIVVTVTCDITLISDPRCKI